ncbi:MAG: hypothetical protein Kow0032_29240 [Methyloligellaceae bacterium]
MRQGQQGRRGRGRGRKAQNPLSRNYESSGPDVKIRGNAAHIAEKYAALARDALASGDPITAENYLQHAEHYNRIIMAAQAQNAGAQSDESKNGSGRQKGEADAASGNTNAEVVTQGGEPQESEAAAKKGNGASAEGSDMPAEPEEEAGAEEENSAASEAGGADEDKGAQPPDNAAA